MNLSELREKNVNRAILDFKNYEKPDMCYWATCIAGEVGELCNMLKKMQRVADGGIDNGHSYTAKGVTKEMLEEEIAGAVIYLDLLSSRLGIDLGEAIRKTFNKTSADINSHQLL